MVGKSLDCVRVLQETIEYNLQRIEFLSERGGDGATNNAYELARRLHIQAIRDGEFPHITQALRPIEKSIGIPPEYFNDAYREITGVEQAIGRVVTEMVKDISDILQETRQAADEKTANKMALVLTRNALKQILADGLIEQVMGQLPGWSTLEHWEFKNVSTLMKGAFPVFVGQHPETQRDCVLVIERGEKLPPEIAAYLAENGMGDTSVVRLEADGTGYYQGAPGGFGCLSWQRGVAPFALWDPFLPGEQPIINALIEAAEECIRPDGSPLMAVDPRRCDTLMEFIDYPGSTHASAIIVNLSAEEMKRAYEYTLQFSNPAFVSAVKEMSDGETRRARLVDLEEYMAINAELREAFPNQQRPTLCFHQHEMRAIEIAAGYLESSRELVSLIMGEELAQDFICNQRQGHLFHPETGTYISLTARPIIAEILENIDQGMTAAEAVTDVAKRHRPEEGHYISQNITDPRPAVYTVEDFRSIREYDLSPLDQIKLDITERVPPKARNVLGMRLHYMDKEAAQEILLHTQVDERGCLKLDGKYPQEWLDDTAQLPVLEKATPDQIRATLGSYEHANEISTQKAEIREAMTRG